MGRGRRPAIGIRLALETGWSALARHPWALMQFTLLLGAFNLLCQLLIRWAGSEGGFAPAEPALALTASLLGWLGYLGSNLWLLVGLLQGAAGVLDGQPLGLRQLLTPRCRPLLRAAGVLAVVAVLLILILWMAQLSSWLLVLLQPSLAPLPQIAGVAASVYLITDQVLCLPLTVLGGLQPLQAVRLGRSAIDPHWLQALGLSLMLGLLVLAGFLLLLVGLTATLPLAACTLVAAYRQLFEPSRKPA